jgi:site-specific recombinase XerD
MQSHTRNSKKSNWSTQWQKVGKRLIGLYRYRPSGMYYARLRSQGKVHWESLKTQDLEFARRKLTALKQRLERTHPTLGRVTLLRWLKETYFPLLRGSESTLSDKARIVARIERTWPLAARTPMRELKATDIERWLVEQFSQGGPSYWNSARSLLQDAFKKALNDGVVFADPTTELKRRKRDKPIRLSPSYEQFKAIIADVRAQRFNADAQDSADFLEACGLLGLGQAELSGMKREHIDLDAGRIMVYCYKTDTGFAIPLYPQARALIERLCEGKKSGSYLFPLDQARKALSNACKRLSLPHYSHRSLRRMFIVRCLELGVDVKTVAEFQGHRDGGQLILSVYSFVRPIHAQRMAQLLTDEEPANVISMQQADAS